MNKLRKFLAVMILLTIAAIAFSGCGGGGGTGTTLWWLPDNKDDGTNPTAAATVVTFSGSVSDTVSAELTGAMSAPLRAALSGAMRLISFSAEKNYIDVIDCESGNSIGTGTINPDGTFNAQVNARAQAGKSVMIVVGLKNSDGGKGIVLYRCLLGRMPKLSELNSSSSNNPINITNIDISAETTAKALFAVDKGLYRDVETPIFTISTSETQVSSISFTPDSGLDQKIRAAAGGDSNVAQVAGAVNATAVVAASNIGSEVRSEIFKGNIQSVSDAVETFSRIMAKSGDRGVLGIMVQNDLPAELKLVTSSGTSTINGNTAQTAVADLIKGIATREIVIAPAFNIKDGDYYGTQTVSITTPTVGADIFYTLDGSVPKNAAGGSTYKFVSPLDLNGNASIKAIAGKAGAITSLVSGLNLVVKPKSSPASDFIYYFSNGRVTINGYNGPGGNVVVPETIDGQQVAYFYNAFVNCDKVTGIVINGNVRLEESIKNCINLTSVVINGAVELEESIKDCNNLTSVIVNNDKWILTTMIALSRFNESIKDCNNLISVFVNGHVTMTESIKNCDKLISVELNWTVMELTESIKNCNNLASVVVKEILYSSEIFNACPNLSWKGIPASSVSFTDADPGTRMISGTLAWPLLDQARGISGYRIYWGESATTKLAGKTEPMYTAGKAETSKTFDKGSILPSGTTHFLIYSYNSNGEYGPCLAIPIEDKFTPIGNPPIAGEFADSDAAPSRIAGNITWTPSNQTTNITGYKIYFGRNVTTRLADNAGAIYTVPVTSASQAITANTELPAGATHFLIYSYKDTNESASCLAIPITDKDGTMEIPSNGDFVNGSDDTGRIIGMITWTPVSQANKISGYRIYWGENATTKLTGNTAAIYSVTGTTGIKNISGLSTPSGATHLLVHSYTATSESASCLAIAINASTPPVSIPAAGAFIDNDNGLNMISGNMNWTPSSQRSFITGYKIYWGESATTRLAGTTEVFTLTGAATSTYAIAPGTALPSRATHFLIYPYNAAGESASCLSVPINDKNIPGVFPTAGAFADTDLNANEISGNLTWTPANPPTGITGYKIYWGQNATTKLTADAIALYTASGSAAASQAVAENTALPAGATHFLIYSYNAYGESSACLAVAIADRARPTAPTAGKFTDNNNNLNVIAGKISWTPAVPSTGTTGYKIYWGLNETTRLSGTIEIATVPGAATAEWTVPAATPPAGALHFLIYSYNDKEESSTCLAIAIGDIANSPDGKFVVSISGDSVTIIRLTVRNYSSAASSLLVIPNEIYGKTVTEIGPNVFRSNSIFKDFTLPNGLIRIGSSAFKDCVQLSAITLPDGLNSIGEEAFSGCFSLSSITLPSKVSSIGSQAFSRCFSLSSITLPNGLNSIGMGAFMGCAKLSAITLPDGLNSIEPYVFNGCASLENITFPTRLNSIGDEAFSGCSRLSSITLPDGLNSIEPYVFKGCSSLENITFPTRLNSIGSGAFMGCAKLSVITLPDGLKNIESGAFSVCENLSSMHFKGDAPVLALGAIDDYHYTGSLTFYYLSGKNGWTTPRWKGIPTVEEYIGSFEDTDIRAGSISGRITWPPVSPSTGITGYRAYWGQSETAKLAGSATPAFTIEGATTTSVEIPANTALPNGATHFLIYPYSASGDLENAIRIAITDKAVPLVVPTNGSFTDTDLNANKISGNLIWTPANPAAGITGYKIYWGQSATARLAGTTEVASVSGALQAITENTALPSGATHFLVYSFNNHGESANCLAVAITDKAIPTAIPMGGAFTDTNLSANRISGYITWTPANPSTGITGYKIYWGQSASAKLAGNESVLYIASGAAAASRPVPGSTIFPAGATHFLIYSYNTDGESANCLAVAITDKIGPTVIPTGGGFSDSDPGAGRLTGNITWTPADPSTGIIGYKIYWGDNDSNKLSGYSTAAYDLSGAATASQAISSTTLPSGVKRFLIYSYNADGESATCLVIPIQDYIYIYIPPPPPPSAPVFSSVATNAAGTKVLVTFDKNIAALPASPAGFAVTTGAGNTANAITAVALNADNKIVELTLTNTVYSSTNNVKAAYTAGTVSSADGGTLASFAAQSVTNSSTAVAPPVFMSAATNTAGTKVLVTFDKNIAALPASPAGFTVTNDAGNTANAITAVALNADNKIVELTLTNTIYSSTVNVKAAYTAGTVSSADGGTLASFAAQSVTNSSTVSNAAPPTFSSANTSSDGTKVYVNFNKNIAALPASPAGFSVTMSDLNVANPITAAALDGGDSKIVCLTVANAIGTSNSNIKVLYTAGTVQAEDGGVLASFGAQDVSNWSSVNTPPYAGGVTTSTTGDQVIITFDKDLADIPPITDQKFTVTTGSANTSNVVTAAALDGSDRKKLILTITDIIAAGAVKIKLNHAGGSVSSQVGGSPLAAFTAKPVTNASTVVATAVSIMSASTSTDGTKVKIFFNKDICDLPALAHQSFSVTTGAGNTPNAVTAAALDGSDRSILELTLTNTLTSATVNIKAIYTPGTIAAEDGGAVNAFNETVFNNVP